MRIISLVFILIVSSLSFRALADSDPTIYPCGGCTLKRTGSHNTVSLWL